MLSAQLKGLQAFDSRVLFLLCRCFIERRQETSINRDRLVRIPIRRDIATASVSSASAPAKTYSQIGSMRRKLS